MITKVTVVVAITMPTHEDVTQLLTISFLFFYILICNLNTLCMYRV